MRTQASLLKTQSNLMASVDNLTRQVADLTTEIAPVQDRAKDKDDFDGTNGAAMSSASQVDNMPADAEPSEQPQKSYEYRKGLKYQTMFADNRIVHESDYVSGQRADRCRSSVLSGSCKFKYALEQGKDEEAEYFLKLIGILYELEEEYRLGMRGDLMQKALNYLKSFWDQLFLYLKDGRYNIDRSALPLGSSKNSLAERMLRPMTIERKRSISDRLLPKGRKNSLGFGSHAGVEVSVIYHTFIETWKMCGVSTLEYFKEFFKAIMQGRTDYENLLPMTIGIKK